VRPTAIDVCAGAGGLSLGLQRAGFDVLGVEHDLAAVVTHRAYAGPCDLADVSAWHPTGSADLVAGGVPCQPFSTQGKRLGLRENVGPLFSATPEPRAQLFRHLIRIAGEANASAVLLENVRGLASWDGGAALAAIREEMVDGGFAHVESRILDAADFGTPQHRQRIFVVGFRCQADHARFAWPKPTHGPGRALPWVTVREALELGRAIDVDAPGYTIGTKNNADILVLDRPARTITTSTHDETADPEAPARRYGPMLRDALGATDQWKGSVRLTAEMCAALQGFPDDWRWPAHVETAHRLIGNAVPPQLGEAVGGAVLAAMGDVIASMAVAS